MKKTFLSIGCLLLACTLTFPATAQRLGSDRLVNNKTDQQLSAPDMAIAFNGWIYNAHRSGDSITVKVSYDHGLSWKPFTSLYTPGESYGPPSVIVTGTNEGDLRLFLAGTRVQQQGNRKYLFVRRYHALTAAFEAEPLLQATEGSLYGCDLASDNGAGSKGITDYSIALLYASASAAADSIIEKVSVDGGLTFAITHIVAAGPEHFRNVSLCYGKSASASNGRYFMTWDAYSKPGSAFGKVYTSRSATTVLSAPIPPIRLDNTDPATENQARNPVIAVSNDADNDSASCTALVLMEAATGNGNTAIYGLYNKRPHYTHYWLQQQVSPDGASVAQPALVYDGSHHEFAASCYNETANSIQLWKAGFRRPQSWKLISGNYADGDRLSRPRPAVAADPANNQIAMSWAAPVSGNTIYFDAEYNTGSDISLSELQAVNAGRYNSLSWNAAGDDGLFTVERSSDRLAFDAIATLPARQTNAAGYHFNDNNAPAGKSYYRIRYTKSGILQYSDIASADKDLLSDNSMTLYPNPAAGELHVALPAVPQPGSVMTVCDLSGRVLMHIPLQAIHTSVDVRRLPAGTYYAAFRTRDTESVVRFSHLNP